MVEWYFETESPLGGISGTGCRNALEGVGLTREEKIVRETMQNSVDALAPGSQRSRVVFRLVELAGADKRKFLENGGLGELMKKRASVLDLPNALDMDKFFDDEAPLDLVYIEDFGTTGLRGEEHHKGANSDFYRFVYLYGDEEKATSSELSLGSYGLGKSVLSSSSPLYAFYVHTVIAPEDEAVPFARTIGCGLYKSHDFEGKSYSGRAWFGDTADTTSAPVSATRNDDANELAGALGFTMRGPDETGTSICIVGLRGDVETYKEAIAKYWWPRLARQELVAEVIDQCGQKHYVRPRQDVKLKKYIEAFELATGIDSGGDEDSKKQELRRTHIGIAMGTIAAKRGLPYEANEEPHALDNKVALLRRKGMVVDYYPVNLTSNQRWFAVFVADAECDDILKLSEPAAHNKWDSGSTRLANKHGDFGKKVVDTIHSRIWNNIKAWFGTPRALQQQEDQRVRRLDELFGKLFSTPGKKPVRPEPNPAPIHVDHLAERWNESTDGAWIEASPVLRLKDDFDGERLRVHVKPACRICEDVDLRPGEAIPVEAKVGGAVLPKLDTGAYFLEVAKHESIEIDLRSAVFDPRLVVDWRLEVTPA